MESKCHSSGNDGAQFAVGEDRCGPRAALQDGMDAHAGMYDDLEGLAGASTTQITRAASS
jgi:hypothetical protein